MSKTWKVYGKFKKKFHCWIPPERGIAHIQLYLLNSQALKMPEKVYILTYTGNPNS